MFVRRIAVIGTADPAVARPVQGMTDDVTVVTDPLEAAKEALGRT